jgi:NADPH:quinone reductase-like Zn-dependent oxidoreductase
MRAVVYRKYGPPAVVRVEEVDKPTAEADEVLVKVHASSVNPYDLHFVTGWPFLMRLQLGLRKPKQPIPGADMAGEVEVAGPNVGHLKPGDEVYGDVPRAYGEYVCAATDRVVIKPDNLTFEQAAAVPLAGITALQGLRDKGQLSSGQRVLINGASGGVGTFAVQIAKAFGAEVTAVCSARNVELVESLGADHVVDYSKEDFAASGRRYDLVLDNVGNRSLKDCRGVLVPGGRYVAAGAPKGHRIGRGPLAFALKVMAASLVRRGQVSMLMAKVKPEDLVFLRELIESGQLVPIIDRSYDLSETADALQHQSDGHAQGKTVIRIMPADR